MTQHGVNAQLGRDIAVSYILPLTDPQWVQIASTPSLSEWHCIDSSALGSFN